MNITKKSDLITEQLNYELYNLLNNTYRMYWQPYHKCNVLKGLYDLIEDNLTAETVMVEIGSYSGVSSQLFAKKVKHISCVDMWEPYPEVKEEYIIEGERRFNAFHKTVLNATKIKKSSIVAAGDFANESLDFVYVDAFHTYAACYEDIKTWLPKIKKNGAIAGHDHHHSDVARAVNDAFPNYEVTVYDDTSWFVKLGS
jgi:predicted O-methyltransferase YrrM